MGRIICKIRFTYDDLDYLNDHYGPAYVSNQLLRGLDYTIQEGNNYRDLCFESVVDAQALKSRLNDNHRNLHYKFIDNY